ncbi:myelin-oligodendrocyte glycoprotein-like [Latimeria chalumnae]|uniref:myelin-oligodendrocyte glycoprotein-like n=1 Tax=Latimeria chalumnae TaxID=7897 RepID=UPI0006D90E68|nr:PREDICTED: myelin-oligodendrocyte glycoprotein-like isoform X2 [Latimeria chalumnae]|eukprot:XP_014353428.1 PREDICTED: myelin-oligodendrocyte glycoprotein-like isoform X2 [Latimeria chalumnae]
MLLSCVTSCTAQSCTEVCGKAGEDVLLPCIFQNNSKAHLSNLTVSWEYVIKGSKNKVVHSYHELRDYSEYQDVQFKGRTKLFHSELKERNTSLLLRNLTEADQGEYDCVVDFHYVKRYCIFVNVTGNRQHSAPVVNDSSGFSITMDHLVTIVPIVFVCIAAFIIITHCIVYRKYRKRRRSGKLHDTTSREPMELRYGKKLQRKLMRWRKKSNTLEDDAFDSLTSN